MADNPFPALARLIEIMEEVLAQTAAGLRLVDYKFEPERKGGEFPHPNLMHVTFTLDPEVTFAGNQAVEPPVDPNEQALFDKALHDWEAEDAKTKKDAAAAKRKADLIAMRDELRDPDSGIGLD